MPTLILIATLAFGSPNPALRTVDVRVDDARRQRFVSNGIEAGVGAAQLSLGIAALTTLDERGPAVRRLATKQVITGTAAVGLGVTFMVLPTALERLQRSSEYARLRRNPTDPTALVAFERRWLRQTRGARRLRLLAGSLTLAAGLGVTAWGAASLRLDDPNGLDGGTTWGVATVNAGLLLAAAGVVDLALRSPIERAWRDYKFGAQRARVQLYPRWGGAAVSVAF